MKILITGGCGFMGSNLAAEGLRRGHEITLLDNLSREGSESNLVWLRQQGSLRFEKQEIRAQSEIDRLVAEIKPEVIFHLAGQVAMTTSLANPRLDFETNVIGGHNILEAVRKHSPRTIITYSSSNKVYGALEGIRCEEGPTRYLAPDHPDGFDEQVRLDFQSPYGCSKGATDQYMLDYARMFGLRTIVFRHSTVFGDRQFSTFDQGWVGWFVQKALDVKQGRSKEPFTISGDGKQVRDILFSRDIVHGYFAAIDAIEQTAGEAFNIGGSMANSLSLLELFAILEQELGVELRYVQLPWRASDQKIFVADISKARTRFGFAPAIDKTAGIRQMIRWVQSHAN